MNTRGFVDFAGSGVVHMIGGIAGLLGTLFLGARKGAFVQDSPVHKGHNVTIAGLGVFILWFGWFGFNPGSQLAAAGMANARAISLIAVNTNLAAATGALTAMFLSWARSGKPNAGMLLNGGLAGSGRHYRRLCRRLTRKFNYHRRSGGSRDDASYRNASSAQDR